MSEQPPFDPTSQAAPPSVPETFVTDLDEREKAGLEKLEQTLSDRRYQVFRELVQQMPDSRVYVVGGAVRDALFDKTSKDIDMLVGGVPHDQLEDFLAKHGRLNLVGKKFGVYKFVPEIDGKLMHPEIDVALPRTEKATGRGGYRDFQVQYDHNLPVDADLGRRDFTFNAMAYDLGQHKLLDPYNGRRDIQNKLVRTVGDPSARFSEDRTRMLRAIRFASDFGFELDPFTAAEISNMADTINETATHEGKVERIVSNEMIGREFVRAFAANPTRTIELLEQTKLLPHVLPEVSQLEGIEQYKVYHPEGNVLIHTKTMLGKLKPDASLNLKLSVLFHDVGKAVDVQIKDLETGEVVVPKDPQEFFKSGAYNPEIQRVQNIGHEFSSTDMAKKIMRRLVLSQFAGDPKYPINEEEILHNVRHHLLQNIKEMRLSHAEPILFYPSGQVRADLLELTLADQMRPEKERYDEALAKVRELSKVMAAREAEAQLPKPLVRGQDLVALGYAPGPEFKKILDEVRERQLTGELGDRDQALAFVKKEFDPSASVPIKKASKKKRPPK